MVSAGVGAVTSALTKVLGAQVLTDVQPFVSALDTMFGGFRERADATYQLLQAPGTAFVVVAAPERDALREASYFVERLAAGGDAAGRPGAQPGPRRRAREGCRPSASIAAAEALEEQRRSRPDGATAAAARRAGADRGPRGGDGGAVPRRPSEGARPCGCGRADGDVHDLAGLRPSAPTSAPIRALAPVG